MTSIAIVIAVSDYGSPQNNLPACTRDGEAIYEVLKTSGRFQEILYVNKDTTSTNVKKILPEFIKKFHGQMLDEVVFYFSGHGDFSESEFYYLLSDYNPRARNRTSMNVSEVDDLIRPLAPNLFVKIVDACHSGRPYIKSRDEVDEYLKSGNSKFKNLYFLFSSQTDQFSYQDDTISYFTDSILKSVYEHGADTIRYADVMSYVSDDFRANSAQTPYFINQADFTEVFLPVTSEIKTLIEKYIKLDIDETDEAPVDEEPVSATKSTSVADRIRENARIFCSEEEAKSIYAGFPELINLEFLSPEFRNLYQINISTSDRDPPNASQIGAWLDKNKDISTYFAVATKKQEKYQKRISVNPLGVTLSAWRGETVDDKYVEATRTVIDGYNITTTVPYEVIRLTLKSDLPNLPRERCYVVPIISRTHVRFFWAYMHFKFKDWDNQVYASSAEWQTDEAFLRETEKIRHILGRVVEGFAAFVEDPLKTLWNA